MSSLRGPLFVALSLLGCGFGACKRHEEPDPPKAAPPASVPSSTAGALAALQSAAALASSPTNDPPQNPGSLASALASATAPSTSASASASTSASASASGLPAGPLGVRLVGNWVFAKFDLTDPATAEKWKAIPPGTQSDILQEAPKASIEFTPQKLITRLTGVPDKTTTWAIESESESALVIKTGDEGRKKISFPDPDTARIEELDKKGAFVTLFGRKKAGSAPLPSGSASK